MTKLFIQENINNIIYKLFLLTTVTVLFIGCIETIRTESTVFKVDKIIISGCNLVKKESLEKQFSYLINKNIYFLDVNDIKTKILDNDFISSVNLIKIYPRIIIIDVIEISPIGIIKSNNTNFLIDNNNNGFLCSSNIYNSVYVPELESHGNIDMENIFNSNEYKILQHIFDNHSKLFNMIKSIRSNEKNIIVDTMNFWISFDNEHYIQQANYISQFLDYTNNKNNYEYIKFSHLDIIVKDKVTIL